MLGSLSVLIVDQACRRPLISMEPGLDTLFSLSMPLPGYADKAWAAARREAAAKAITSLVQRDHDARMQLMMTGGVPKLLALLDSKVGRHNDQHANKAKQQSQPARRQFVLSNV